jgi:dTDP-3-amino-3,4,6-trideoxy-alpha-D-glucose transaminase
VGLTVAAFRIAMNDFPAQWRDRGALVREAVQRVGAGGRYILGEEVARFEALLAARWGVGCAVGCASGLDAVELGLRAAGVAAGDLVLTTPLSAFATTLAILRCGARPVFSDTDALGLLDLDAAEQWLAADPRIRALVPVHLYGHALDLERLQLIRQRRGVVVVEDCAQAVGASWRGRPVGSVGDAAAVSFYPTKNLGCLGDGGAVLATDPGIAARVRVLRDYGQSAKYVHDEIGLNSRLDEVQAALLADAFLPMLDLWTARRRQIAAAYRGGIANPRVAVPELPDGCESVWHLFPLAVVAGERGALAAHLAARGIASAVHYPRLIPDQGALASLGGAAALGLGGLETARALAGRELSIPLHPYLADEDVAEVVDAVNSWT